MYTYKDRELTKEQVDKLAAEKGVEVDVFLTNNPDIQIQEAVVETTEPEGKTPTTEMDTTVDATKVSEITESLSEDGSLELEETKYKTPLTLEEKKSLQNNQFSKQMSKEDNFTKERLEELTKEKEDIVSGYDTVIERELGVNEVTDFFGDLYRAGEQGFEQAKAVDPSIDIYRAGAETSDEQIIKWIETNKSIADKSKESEEMQSFNKIYKENGGSWLGFIKGVAKNPSTLSSMLVSSMATQLGSLQSEEVLASAAAGGTAGAAGGSLFAGIGAIPGGLAGAMSGTMTAMETGLTFSELLTEEVGEDIDVEKVRKILENPEKLAELKNKALGRGVAIGAIELATMGLAKGVGGKIAKAGFKGAKPAGIAAAGAVEVVGGGSGEVAGRFVADQEMDIAEIGFEAFAGLGSAPVTMANQLTDLGRNVDIANLNKFLNETNYKEVTEAFSPEVKTSEAQVKMAQSKNAVDIIDKKLKQEVIDGVKTPEEADAVALNFRETQGAVNQIKPLKLSTEDQAIAVQLMKEKKQLSNEIKQVGEANLTIEQSNRIKEIDNDLKGIGSKAVTREVEKVKKAAESIKDLDVQEFASTEETEAFLNKQNQDPKASGQQGFIIQDPKTGKQTIVINREIADKEIAVAAPSHEFLHALLFQTVKDSPETQLALGNSLKEYINKIDVDKVVKDSNFAKRLEQYKSDPEAVQAEEVLTLFSDAIRTEDIKFNETVFTKVGDVIRKALQALGIKVKFNNGKDVYNFIKDYNKSLESTGLTKAQVKAAEGVTGELVADKVKTDEQIIKESRSEEASTRVQELYDTQGEAAAFDIIEQFKPITSKIVEKRSQAPGFDRQLLTDEIETGKRGILDLVREYDAESGVPLAAYINKFLPARAIEASKRILGEEFTDDVTEAKGVAAEEVAVDVAPTDKSTTSKLRRVLGIKQDDAIYDLAKEVSGEILSSDLPGKKVKTAINKEARKSKLRKAVSDLMGTEKAIDEQFLNKNILEILKALPASDLVKLEREAKVKVLAEQGPRLNVKDAREAVNKGLLPKDTNLQSGPKVSSKLPTTLEQAKEFFTQKRKAGLVNVVTEMLVKDAAPEVTRDKMEPAKRAKVLSEIDRAPTLKFSKINEFIDSQDFIKTELELAAENKVWKYIAKELGVDVLSSKKPEDVIKYRNWVKANASKFPKSFFTTGTFANAGTSAAKRNFYFTSAEDLNTFLEGVEFAKEDADIAEAVNRQTYVTGGADGKISDKFKKAFNTKEFKEKQASKLIGLKKIYKIFETIIDENPSDASFVIAMLSSTSQGMGHFVRTSAPIKFYSKYLEGGIVEEHTMPASLVAKYLFTSAINKTIDKDFKDIERNYFQGALGKFDDKKLKGKKPNGKPYNYTSMTPEGWKITDNIWARYFNINVAGNNFGIDPNNIVLADGKTVFETYGVSNTGALVSDQFNSDQQKASVSNNKNLPADLRVEDPKSMPSVLSETKVVDENNVKEEIKFSKALDLNKDFNDIIENKTGVASDKTYAKVKAEVAGANKGKFNFFIPPSAEDFVGLLYSTLGKGSTGDAQMAWYKAHLLNPFARAMENLANDRAAMMQDFRGLKKALKIVPKNLRKKIKDSNFTQEQAVRAYIWDQQGMEIPGLSNKDQKDLVDFIESDENLKSFASELIAINKGDGYAAPDAGWVAGTIGTDFIKALNTTKRSKYLEVWQQNVDQIFSEANLNKLEAAYGANYREAMVDMLKRMKTGKNTSSGSDRLAARFTDWLTNSVGAIMFFNTRSAVLQTISAVNFINFSDNNVLKAGAAFANQPQYWSDFKKLFNSPFLLDRRSGLKLNVNEADIAAMAKGPGNSARNVIAGILKAGFLPTQLADSFAIASGGASFYRNRIKALKKEGLTEAEAEEVAFRDFREIAEESQQSSRPDKISQQQAGPLGRVVLAFANTPAQYARLIKKAASDLKNGRGDAKTNISKIIYYGVAQNLLFSALQQALFAIAFDDEEEEEKKNEKYFNIINGMSDSILRGVGVGGAIVSVVKNTALKLAKEADKKSPKYQDAVVKGVLQISPPVSSKVGKLQSAGRSFSWNQEEMRTRGWSIDNPAYLASANVISAATNVPLDRAVKKVTNIVDAGNEDIEYYKRVALALGWSAWELGIDKKGGKVAPPKTDMDKLYDLNKKQQIDSLLSLGISKKQIKALKLEEDRVNAILNPKSIKQIKVSKRDSLFGLNKKDQVKALEKLGLTKKEIRALRLESDRVEAIINKQKKEVE